MNDLKSILLSDTNASSWKRGDLLNIARANSIDDREVYKLINKMTRVAHGTYAFSRPTPSQANAPIAEATPVMNNVIRMQGVMSVMDSEIFIPDVDETFVRWGEYSTLLKVIKSRLFFPTYVAGMSGNGKTFMIEQACAQAKREYIRVQISPETDEDDLIGGFRLINGETVFQKGPVVKAMERGCILLIDEIDRASNKIMCLQGVLEGNPVLLKKTGEVIRPADGFNVIATANTKGRGSDDGRYSAATIIDDAFLERFTALVDQPFPQANVETKILENHAQKYEMTDNDFIPKLIAWASVIRKTFEADAIEDVISTRRLCHIVKAMSIFGNRSKAIAYCINRFESETREAFLDLYTKIDESQLNENGEVVSESESADTTSEQQPPIGKFTY